MARILLSIPLDRCKSFLDTPIFRALKQRHQIFVFSYLADREEFTGAYSEENIRFYPAPMILGSLRYYLFNLTEIFRHFGFLYKWRNGATALYWPAQTKYKWGDPRQPNKNRPVRYFALLILSSIGNVFPLRKLLITFLGRWIYWNPGLDMFFKEYQPTVYICTAHKTDQEKILAYYASKYKLFSIFVPDSTDNFAINGFTFHDFDWYCMWGSRMNEHAKQLHGIKNSKLVKLGVPVNRLYEDLIKRRHNYNFRNQFQIPPSLNIITYLSIFRQGYQDLIPTIDYLLECIDSGQIKDSVLLLRPSPWEDSTELEERYGTCDGIRIQSVPKGGFDAPGNYRQIQYIETLRQSSVVVMSAITGAVLQSCLLGIPTIANVVQISEYAVEGVSPQSFWKRDPLNMFKAGLPAAHSLEELLGLINGYLDDPQKDRDIWKRIADEWDYRNPRYVEDFMGLIEGVAPDGRPPHEIIAVEPGGDV